MFSEIGKAMDADPILADNWKTFSVASYIIYTVVDSYKPELSICVGQSYRKNIQYTLFQ